MEVKFYGRSARHIPAILRQVSKLKDEGFKPSHIHLPDFASYKALLREMRCQSNYEVREGTWAPASDELRLAGITTITYEGGHLEGLLGDRYAYPKTIDIEPS